jgi:hypothetical protein
VKARTIAIAKAKTGTGSPAAVAVFDAATEGRTWPRMRQSR